MPWCLMLLCGYLYTRTGEMMGIRLCNRNSFPSMLEAQSEQASAVVLGEGRPTWLVVDRFAMLNGG